MRPPRVPESGGVSPWPRPQLPRKGRILSTKPRARNSGSQCGLSKKQPYCDGSHKGTEFRPIIVDITESKTVLWCGCKQSGRKPYCDGTHSRI
ncbi:MAG: CDGSH iron-sulfur domain-containing protein [SAR324 cluster bacterium]|nr:CDGSH iron-sulfur domain-containing protein [SAR324 cluster bacterium]MCZ6728133.1 CDGSH iron-sulfur domain-containing protein [SAR324 cluster bacterium]